MPISDLPTLAEVRAMRRAVPKSAIVPRVVAKAEQKKSKEITAERGQADRSYEMRKQLAKGQKCSVCGKLVLRRRAVTCSVKCGGIARRLRTYSERACRHCDKRFVPTWARQHHCSLLCSKAASAPIQTQITCAQCARIFFRRLGRHVTRYQMHFCNTVCRGKYVRGENHALYRGDADPNRGRGWQTLAETIRKRDKYVCRRCGKTQQENKQKLSVDHVRPWRSFENKDEANKPENLVTLCRSCHAKKTAVAEAAWLRGDVLAMQAYRIAVGLESPRP